MKKIVKLLPVAFALMLINPAFADPSNKAQSDLSVTVAPFINITKEAETPTANARFNDAYTTLDLDTTLSATFKVVNNVPDKVIYLRATCPSAGGDQQALYGTAADAINIVFTNSSRQSATPTNSVSNITGATASAAQNPNAIAFAIKPTITPDTTTGAATPTAELSGKDGATDNVKYTIKNGVYTMKYDIQGSALANTFSTHDTDGTYKATLYLTDVNP